MFKNTIPLLLAFSSSLFCSAVQADWTLNNEQSSLNFATAKNITVSEVHHFKTLSGEISDDGKASLVVSLASVDTANPIRDERLEKQVFEIATYPNATVSLDLGADGVKAGLQKVTATLSLHGVEKEIVTEVFVEQSDKSIQVTSVAPIVIIAPDFGLEKGVEELRVLAALKSINVMVPATFRLVYDKQ
ncbi:YceI family protein [Leucothrix arctica]|uniref:YceI family protein n=1 Tax=Leucothrix arctica TaxID=1481894 RepID=A0A317CIW1_9GAMM|nr:YceI family protein [Leucothrix arctica]PWQ97363.1 YceI family protein [Leucothrix arctica]